MTDLPQNFRQSLSRFASGVTIVTASDGDGNPVGMTVSAFSSLSLDPPLVLVCLDKGSYLLDAFTQSDYFCVNILAQGQQDVSNDFARGNGKRFDGLTYDSWDSGCPIIPGNLASLECRRTSIHEEGDHLIFVGEVKNLSFDEDGDALLYYRGSYRTVGEPPTPD